MRHDYTPSTSRKKATASASLLSTATSIARLARSSRSTARRLSAFDCLSAEQTAVAADSSTAGKGSDRISGSETAGYMLALAYKSSNSQIGGRRRNVSNTSGGTHVGSST